MSSLDTIKKRQLSEMFGERVTFDKTERKLYDMKDRRELDV